MKRSLSGVLALALAAFASAAHAQLPPPGTPPIVINTTPVTGGTNGNCLYINLGTVGQQACGITGLVIGTTTITGGGTGRILYDNAGALGELTTTGTGTVAVLANSPTIAAPIINGLPTGTAVASSNTASTLVARDASGNFSAGIITAVAKIGITSGGQSLLVLASATGGSTGFAIGRSFAGGNTNDFFIYDFTNTALRVSIPDAGGMTIGATGLATVTGELALNKIAASGLAPGAGGLKLAVVTGTNAGSCKIIAYAGTSATPVTVIDNVGSGC